MGADWRAGFFSVALLVAAATAAVGGCTRAGFDREDAAGVADAAADAALDLSIVDARDGSPSKHDGPGNEMQISDGAAPEGWVTLSKGTFMMGSLAGEPCRCSEEERHSVTLTRGFEIQKTEVTQGQFQALMGYNPAHFKTCGSSCPVERVNWYEAAAYCNALSQQQGRPSCYSCSGGGTSVTCQPAAAYAGQAIYSCPGYRLPTEAEFEYARRAGTTTAYSGGPNDLAKCKDCAQPEANLDKSAWYCANASSRTHPVAKKQPNAWGLFDMAGNVWELCHDWYAVGGLGSVAATDPWGAASGTQRLVRGGAWNEQPDNLRAAMRAVEAMDFRVYVVGFRCVRTK